MNENDQHATQLEEAATQLRILIVQAKQAGLTDEQISSETGLSTEQITRLVDGGVSDQT